MKNDSYADDLNYIRLEIFHFHSTNHILFRLDYLKVKGLIPLSNF